jgi:putative transcriptional regulator
MSNNVGDELIEGMKNAVAHARGRKRAARETVVAVFVPKRVNVARIRRKLRMSQEAFALRYGFSVKNIRNWEQGIRQPEGSARAYLTVIEHAPKMVEKALRDGVAGANSAGKSTRPRPYARPADCPRRARP